MKELYSAPIRDSGCSFAIFSTSSRTCFSALSRRVYRPPSWGGPPGFRGCKPPTVDVAEEIVARLDGFIHPFFSDSRVSSHGSILCSYAPKPQDARHGTRCWLTGTGASQGHFASSAGYAGAREGGSTFRIETRPRYTTVQAGLTSTPELLSSSGKKNHYSLRPELPASRALSHQDASQHR